MSLGILEKSLTRYITEKKSSALHISLYRHIVSRYVFLKLYWWYMYMIIRKNKYKHQPAE